MNLQRIRLSEKKKNNPKNLCTVWFYLYNFFEMAKSGQRDNR